MAWTYAKVSDTLVVVVMFMGWFGVLVLSQWNATLVMLLV
jgi:hypothetical protein